MPVQLSLKKAIYMAVAFTFILWIITSAETLFGFSLHTLGVYPNQFSGAIGVVTGPLIHGSYEHLANNSVALLLLITALHYGYPNTRYWVFFTIWFGSGVGTWLFAREAFHFGASGLTHGMFFFLFVSSILRRDKRSIVLMMIAFLMYGGMVHSVLPREPGISFEYHLFGAISGFISALLLYKKDPKLEEPKYEWEQEGYDNNDEDIIGDEWKTEGSVEHAELDEESANTNNKILH